MYVVLRNVGHRHVCRIEPVRPSQGELFYLCAILQNRPVLSFDDVLCTHQHHYTTYQEAAVALGVFGEHGEAHYAMEEAMNMLYTPHQLRLLFVHLLVNDCKPKPLNLWEKFKHALSLDFLTSYRSDERTAHELTLETVSNTLEEHGKNIGDFGLPQHTRPSIKVIHERGKWSSDIKQHNNNARGAYLLMTHEQQQIFDTIIQAAVMHTLLQIFIDGKAGRGKTFLVNAICSKLHSLQHIVLPTATAASAALLYPGGRTTHSTFKVHFLIMQSTTNNAHNSVKRSPSTKTMNSSNPR